MILSSPTWCWLSLLALLPWIGPWRGSDRVQNVLRSMLFVTLALALAQPRIGVKDSEVDRILILDRSASVDQRELERVDSQLDRFTESGRPHLVGLGQPIPESKRAAFQTVTWIEDSPSQGSSPLSAALSRAASLITRGSGGSVTLVSDALPTRPDDDRAVTSLREREIPIHWVELPTVARPPTPVRVDWTTPLRKGSTSRLKVRVVASESDVSGRVALKQGDKTLAAAPLAAKAEQVVVLEFEPTEAGFIEAEVMVSREGGPSARPLPVVLPIQDAPRLLYLGNRQIGGSDRLAGMIGPSFDVQTVDSQDSDALATALVDADLVMMDDLAAESFPVAAEQQIVDAVQSSGLGLVMSGGRAAFGAGGWHNRPIETLLPIEFVQKEEKRDPSTSLVIVIDTSGSMTGVRVQLAKEVARLAMRRLLPHDKVGIVEFYGAKRWAAPLQPASNAIELQRALNRMDAGGGTVILPALEEAFYGLQNVDTRYKHVLVLTDGGVEAGDFESLMRRMAAEGINVSTVLAGGGYHSEFLVNLANWGKGRFYNVPNRFNLPEILLKQPSTTKLPSYRPGTHAVRVRGGAGWWGDIDTARIPSLSGYVESKPRPGSQVLLETVTEKHPVLSTWRYGLGRVTTFTTEPLGAGTQPWQQWSDYARALTRILQRSASDSRDPFRFEVEYDGGEAIVHAIRQQSRANSDAHPMARLVAFSSVDGESPEAKESLTFTPRSPDRFLARMPAPLLGETIRVETSADSTPSRWQPFVISSPVIAEDRVDPQAQHAMDRLVTISGGQRFTVADDWTQAPTSMPAGPALFSLGSWLFGITLLLFLAEIVWRRLPASSTRTQSTVFSTGASRTGSAAACLLGIVFAIGLGTPTHAQIKISDELAAQTNRLIDRFVQEGVDRQEVSDLFARAILADGSVEPLLDWLQQARGDLNQSRGQVIAETEVHLSSRLGDLQRASSLLSKLLAVKGVAKQRRDLQLWQAKLHDALGEVDQARTSYESLLEQPLSGEDQQTVRLRLALMGLIVAPRTPSGGAAQRNDAKPLIELAKNSTDVAFRNRAAIVLAVQNKYAEAIELFKIRGEGTDRFRDASRVTEWAIRAQNRDKAIETAWDAANSAELKRDRNYALALLVESYRLKENKAGLEKLVQEFQTKSEAGEALPDESKRVWIDLLRELGQYDKAIELFKSTATDAKGFTIEMRRELLEMEGEAGYEDRMIESYRQLIQSEPDVLTWRAGLTQVLLEKGQEDEAKSLWTDYILQTHSRSLLLNAAQTLGEFGLDDLAKQTIERMVQLRANHGQALLYWADLQQRRGKVAEAEATLNRIQAMDDIGDDVLAELASAYERLGRQDKAIEVNEAIRANRETVAEDLEMRLAWLYSEVGDEERGLEQWMALWRKTTSIPRRRYVEDRLMTVASRLGTLADIAIELEEKLADGTADDREAGLLVRIYSRVNDSVAATEIAEEYMSQTGKGEVERLQEQARIYQICNDYWNYEKVIQRLIEIDPEGETEYLRQLALSMLERGKAQQAREVLISLREADDGKDSIGGEFEAGVLSLVGLNAEAVKAYWKGIATYPDRIESYLLLANLLKEMDQTEQAIGMFQYLAENAQQDDLFTIAIDGILNMEASGPVMQWARRITLERLAGREDKNYLYQLLADLSAEVNDKSGQIRALENSLAVSGTRRLSLLRECMELSSNIRGGVYYSSSSRGPSNRGNQPFFAFGRRLIGLGELMPPQVFLDLGQAFLDDGDSESAERTFAMARHLADPRAYQREVAAIFEKAGKIPEALVRYEKLLRTSPSDVPLIARVAKLNEQSGKDQVAYRFYLRGLNLLLSQTPLTTQEVTADSGSRYWASNRDAYDTYSAQLLEGLLVTAPDDQVDDLLNRQAEWLRQSLQQLDEVGESGRVATTLSDAPRIDKRSATLRSLYFAFDRIDELEAMDQLLIDQFPEDQNLTSNLARQRIAQGRFDSVQRMLDTAQLNDQQRRQLLGMLGDMPDESPSDKLTPKVMWNRFLPVWMAGDREKALQILRRVDPTQGRSPGARPTYVIVNGVAVMQNAEGSSDIAVWMRLAVSLGDDGLALQFARSHLATGNRYGVTQTKQLFATYRAILPEQAFGDLVRYAANLYKDDKQQIAAYLWLLSQMPQYLGDETLSDSELLQRVEDSDLQINYYFPFSLAMDAFPDSIRAEAMAIMLDRMVPKYRPRELVQIPFRSDEPIDDAVGQVLLESLESGIEDALQDNYLRYCLSSLPRSGTAVPCPENVDLAIKVLDLLMTEDIRKREANISQMAEFIKAVLWHQSGQTDKALDFVLKQYDPKANVPDSYVRLAREWAYRELVPIATNRFLEQISDKDDASKRSISETDQRLAIVRQAGDEALLRQEYLQAIEDHPDQAKYVSTYERWERSLNHVFPVIAMTEERLNQASRQEDEKDDAKTTALKTQLGQLWLSVNHIPKALPFWTIADDQDRERFLKEQAERAKREPAQPAVEEKSDQAKQSSKSEKSKSEKQYPASIAGVKSAIDDGNFPGAQFALRKIWRKFPPPVATPYGYRRSTRQLNGLAWPAENTDRSARQEAKPPEDSDESRQAELEEARRKARQGLAVFTPESRPPRPQPLSAWKALADYPFAVSEMKRIMRSREGPTIANVRDVSLGLLQADRNQRGDQAVFASLVEKVQRGHVGEEVIVQLFAMLEEDYGRINKENESVIDALLERVDLTNGRQASQLAEVYAEIGQFERAKRLYQFCASLTTSGGISFDGLIAQARKVFDGDELMALAESMYELTSQTNNEAAAILDLRLELLDPKSAAVRSIELIEEEETQDAAGEMRKAIRAVPLFARAGEYEIAADCLTRTLLKHGEPRSSGITSGVYYSSNPRRNLLTVGRQDLIHMFPETADGYVDYDAWLREAAEAAVQVAGESKSEIIVETLLTIAFRQCQRDKVDEAAATLSLITDEMLAQAAQHELLAIDVMRLAGLTDRALHLQAKLADEQRLSHLRFGDLLRDTAAVSGKPAASRLLDKLTEQSMDQDLIRAAEEIAEGDPQLADRARQLRSEWEAAKEEYESRVEAARKRAEIRKQWREDDAARRKPVNAEANRESPVEMAIG